MINVEVVLPDFSRMLEVVIAKKYGSGVILSHLAFSDEEHELFGSAIKYCCNYKNVTMTILGNPLQCEEMYLDANSFGYDNVVSLGKKVKELSILYRAIRIPSEEFNKYCSNCKKNK